MSISNVFASILEYITGFVLSDIACGARVYVSSLAKEFTKLRGFGYALEVEQLLVASLLELSVIDYPIHSKLQACSTNAEKIEDNLFMLINYANELKISTISRATLCFMMTQVKRRKSFEIDMKAFNKNYLSRFNYIGENMPFVDGYTNQIPMDVYEISILR